MIYLDCAATTPPFSEAIKAFEEVSLNCFGNPSSLHTVGFAASKVLENARNSILNCLGVSKSHRLIFTSGASEANSLAIKGAAFHYKNRGKRIITSAVEHPSVLKAFEQLGQEFGFEVIELPVNAEGKVEPETLENAMNKETILVSIMAVNNETGSINDLPALLKVVRKFPKALFHSDLTQAIGKVDLPLGDLDMFSFSAHKFGGLKGNGTLIYKSHLSFLPLISGGHQEAGLRGGTVDVAGANAMSAALSKTYSLRKEEIARVQELNAYLKQQLSEIDEASINSPSDASPFVLNFSLLRHKASVVVEALSEKGICVSSVSACNSKGEPASYVLLAMGKTMDEAKNSIRVSFGINSNKGDVDAFITELKVVLEEVNPR